MTAVHPLAFGRRGVTHATHAERKDPVVAGALTIGYASLALAVVLHGGLDLILGAAAFVTTLRLFGRSAR